MCIRDSFKWRLGNLLRFLTASPVRCDHIQLELISDDAHESQKLCELYGNLAATNILTTPQSNHMLFRFEAIKDHWPSIVQAYFEDATTFHNSFYLLSSDISKPPHGLENRFLALVQCLEGITRCAGTQTYVSKQKYGSIQTALLKAIPPDTDEALKDKIKSMLRYGNERSLRKRINAVLANLEPETQSLIYKNQSAFVAGIVDTRNFWTHVLAEKTTSILEGDDLMAACDKLQTLLLVLLAIRIKVPEPTVRAGLLGSDWMTQKRVRYLAARER